MFNGEFCNWSICNFRHPKTCYFYTNEQNCVFGTCCEYLHPQNHKHLEPILEGNKKNKQPIGEQNSSQTVADIPQAHIQANVQFTTLQRLELEEILRKYSDDEEEI